MAPNPVLDEKQLLQAHELLDEVRALILELADGDEDLVFAFRRKVAKELTYDERSKPEKRRRLKRQVFERQDGKCAECREPLEMRGSVLDRNEAKLGYTKENVQLLHASCDRIRQDGKGFT